MWYHAIKESNIKKKEVKKMDKKKLTAKDFITVGIFTAIVFVISSYFITFTKEERSTLLGIVTSFTNKLLRKKWESCSNPYHESKKNVYL